MTPLRQRMIEDMELRNFAEGTKKQYVAHVAAFARYFNRSPEELDQEAVRQYLLYLINERKVSAEAVNQQSSALKFLYLTTLEMPWSDADFPRCRRGHKLPVVLSSEELLLFFDNVPSLKYRAALMVCYGAGLRVSEAVTLKVSDIDSKRMLIRVEQGKGKKDRYAMLSVRLLHVLRRYWVAAKPTGYLFASWREGHHLSPSSLQQACRDAANLSGLRKKSRLIRCDTASPRICSRAEPTFESFRCCSGIVASTLRPAIPPFHRVSSAQPSALSTIWSPGKETDSASRTLRHTEEEGQEVDGGTATARGGKHLSTTRASMASRAPVAFAATARHARHRDLPYGCPRPCGAMRPLLAHSRQL
jgi:site-specific recombinase XerD